MVPLKGKTGHTQGLGAACRACATVNRLVYIVANKNSRHNPSPVMGRPAKRMAAVWQLTCISPMRAMM
jgi:hypothetical protein